MPNDSAHDFSPSATAIDAATLTARQLARAAANASSDLDRAELATKPKHARQWRVSAFGMLHECRMLARRAMLELANAAPGELPLASDDGRTVELAAVLRELDTMAERETTLTGNDAVRRAAAMLIAKMGGAR